MLRGFSSTITGEGHKKANSVCQDASGVSIREKYAAAVVADGHGGYKHFRSDVGSKWAVRAAIETIEDYMEDYGRFSEAIKKDPSYMIGKICKMVLLKWNGLVERYDKEHEILAGEKERFFSHLREGSLQKELKKRGLSQAEQEQYMEGKLSGQDLYQRYGTTLLAAVQTADYCYGFLIGDGGYVVLDGDGEAKIELDDPNSFANYTPSLCNFDAIGKMQHFFAPRAPLAMFVSTDGLIKSFCSEEDFLDYHRKVALMLPNMESCKANLEKNFEKRTKEGSEDDISIAIIFDAKKLPQKSGALKAALFSNEIEKERKFLEKSIEKEQFDIAGKRKRIAFLDGCLAGQGREGGELKIDEGELKKERERLQGEIRKMDIHIQENRRRREQLAAQKRERQGRTV